MIKTPQKLDFFLSNFWGAVQILLFQGVSIIYVHELVYLKIIGYLTLLHHVYGASQPDLDLPQLPKLPKVQMSLKLLYLYLAIAV